MEKKDDVKEKDGEPATLFIAREFVNPLIDRFGMVKNELSSLLDLPLPSSGTADAALAWWQAKTDGEQYTLRAALGALAAPLLIADTGINIRNERLINTHVILPSLRWNDPVFLVASENDGIAQLRLEYLQKADIFTRTLLLYLESASPVYSLDMKFEIPVQDFAVLLAAVDLRQRAHYQALLDHAVFPVSYTIADITAGFTAGFAFPDPRWLFPFTLPALHLKAHELAPDTIRQSLARLAATGLMKPDGNSVSFTEAGETLAESLGGRITSVRLDLFGVDSAGNPGRQSVVLIRGEHLLWFAGSGGTKADMVVVASITMDTAGALLQELFTPAAVPKPAEPTKSGAPAATPAAAMPAATPPKSAPGSVRMFCPSCGAHLRPGLKFCSSCGAKIP